MKKECVLCGGVLTVKIKSPLDREYFKVRNLLATIEQCQNCYSLQQDPLPSYSEVSTFYDSNYQNYNSAPSFVIRKLFSLLSSYSARDFIKRYGRDKRVLDFGCGFGNFLISLSQQGANNLFGFDYIPQADKAGIRFFGSLEQLKLSGLKFDVIRMNHVIEHLVGLDETMIDLKSLLVRDGILIGQTPNPNSFSFTLFKSYWGGLHYPYHTFLISPDGLKQSSGKWGFEVMNITTAILPTGWSMSFENLYKTKFSIVTKGRSPFYSLFLFLSLPFVLLEILLGLFGRTGSVYNFTLKKYV